MSTTIDQLIAFAEQNANVFVDQALRVALGPALGTAVSAAIDPLQEQIDAAVANIAGVVVQKEEMGGPATNGQLASSDPSVQLG